MYRRFDDIKEKITNLRVACKLWPLLQRFLLFQVGGPGPDNIPSALIKNLPHKLKITFLKI